MLKNLDVHISDVPKNIIVIPKFDAEEEIIILQVHQYDRNDYLGWSDEFLITLNDTLQVKVPPSVQLEDYHTLKIPTSNFDFKEKINLTHVPRKIPYIIWNVSAGFEKQNNGIIRRQVENVRHLMELIHIPEGYTYNVLNDDDCRREISESSIEGLQEAYHSLRAGSFKADLMRYWLLYKYGGIYVDDKTLIREPLDTLKYSFLQADLFVGVHRTPEIAFMGCRPDSPIILNVLRKAVDTIRNRDYTSHRLGITGNFLFTEVLNSQQDVTIEEGIWRKFWGENVALLRINIANDQISWGDKTIWQKSVIPNRDWPRTEMHYSNLWENKRVYVDGNPEVPFLTHLFLKIPFLTILICIAPFILGYLIKWLQHEVYSRSRSI